MAAANPGNESLRLHINLLHAAYRDGVPAAYRQLHGELNDAQITAVLAEWLAYAPNWAASATYLAEHRNELSDPAATAALLAATVNQPEDTQRRFHLGLLLLDDDASTGYAALGADTAEPCQRAEALLSGRRRPRAVAWAASLADRNQAAGAPSSWAAPCSHVTN